MRPRFRAEMAFPLLGFLMLLLRRPEAVFAAQFDWEEGAAFYVPTFFHSPIGLIIEPWGGYLNVVQRIGYLMTRAVPIFWAPLIENLLAIGIVVAVAAFAASSRMANSIPDRRLRILLASVLLLLPAQQDMLGTLLDSGFYLALWLVLLTMAHPARGAARWLERGGVLLVALSGPFSILLMPLFWWRRRGWLAAIVTAGALVQILVILVEGRQSVETNIGLAALLSGYRLALVPLLGEGVVLLLRDSLQPALLIGLGLAILGTVLLLMRSLPRDWWPLGYGALAIGAGGFTVTHAGSLWDPREGERYFLLAGFFVAVAIIIGLVGRSRPAFILAPLLVIGIVANLRLLPAPDQHWEAHYSCIRHDDPCVIPVYPAQWTIHWPGNAADYFPARQFFN